MKFAVAKKPHAVCIPLPFQSHIIALLKAAKLLHFKGFHITFVNTEFNHLKLLKSATPPDSLKGVPDFRFETIPDGLPPSDINVTQDNLALWDSITNTCVPPLRNLIVKLNEASSVCSSDPPVSCIVSDVLLSNSLDVAEEFGIPGVLLWPMSTSVLWCCLHYEHILQKIIPLKGSRNGYLNMSMDLIPGTNDFRLKDLPSFFWDGNDNLLEISIREVHKARKASAIILNTFDDLERDGLEAIKPLLPAVYAIGPLELQEVQIQNKQLKAFKSNLWKEDDECLKWLDSQKPNSVVYVNFGSTTVITSQQLIEFAWGLANSKHPFLWVLRPNLVIGEAAVLPPEFTKQTADRGWISGWCPQEKVLCHSSTGGFLTHSGWNSTMDTICGGVPIISWPFFGDQRTNCRYASVHWGFGAEMDKQVERVEVEELVRELMEGKKGKGMKDKAIEWRKRAEEATQPEGSSYVNLDRIITEVLVHKKLG